MKRNILFVTIIFFILFILYMVLPHKYYHFYVILNNLNGINVGAPVYFNERRVGAVSNIRSIGAKQRVNLKARTSAHIPRNSLITISHQYLKPYSAYIKIESVYLKNGIISEQRFIKRNETIIGTTNEQPPALLVESQAIMPGYWSSLKEKPEIKKVRRVAYAPLSPTELLANAIMRNNEVLAQTANEFKNAASSIRQNTGRFGTGINRLLDNMNNLAEEQRRSLYTTTNNFAAISQDMKKTVDEIYKFSKIKPKIEVKVAASAGIPKAAKVAKAVLPTTFRGKREWKAPSIKDLITNIKPHLQYGLEYNSNVNALSNDVNLKLAKGYEKDYFIAGITRQSGGYKYNLQYSNRINDWSQRIGLIESKVGLGLDYNFNDNSKVSMDVKGLTVNPEIDVYGQYKLRNDYRVKFGIDNFYRNSHIVFGISKQY